MSTTILITLKSGWRFVADEGSLRRGRKLVRPELPPGAVLCAALQPASPEPQRPWPAERELARYLHLVLPPEQPMIETLLAVRGWLFVERAELPPLTAV